MAVRPRRVRSGGLRQQMRRQQQQQQQHEQGGGPIRAEPEGGISNLAKLLVEKWCWGHMSLPLLQKLAAAGVADGLEQPLLRLQITQTPPFFGGGGCF